MIKIFINSVLKEDHISTGIIAFLEQNNKPVELLKIRIRSYNTVDIDYANSCALFNVFEIFGQPIRFYKTNKCVVYINSDQAKYIYNIANITKTLSDTIDSISLDKQYIDMIKKYQKLLKRDYSIAFGDLNSELNLEHYLNAGRLAESEKSIQPTIIYYQEIFDIPKDKRI